MKKLSLAVVVGLSLILSSCGSSTNTGNSPSGAIRTQPEPINHAPQDQKVSKAECMNGCYVMWKSNPGNAEKPESEMENNCQDICNMSQWMQNNDLSSCDKVSEPIAKSGCYGEVAKQAKNAEICNKITEPLLKDTCIMGVAEVSGDASLCEKISEPIMKPACQDSVKGKE